MQDLPDNLYCVESIIQLESIAIQQFDIPAYELMTRAGTAVFETIKTRYSDCKKILVFCGAGNNAGDGYIVARLARQDGFDVHVVSLSDPANLKGAASTAYKAWSEIGEVSRCIGAQPDFSQVKDFDIIVDALLGTGLKRQVSDVWCSWIKAINESSKPIISIDIPSGLYADTGSKASEAICADTSVSFIGLKQGMFTAQAKDYCGEIIYSDLSLPTEVFSRVIPDAKLIKTIDYSLLTTRKASSHKGSFGHVLIAGGNAGMAGAVILAARATLRSGAGLVTIVTIKQHLTAISEAVPEAMVKVCASTSSVEDDVPSVETLFEQDFINDITHIAVGMGLGQGEWSLSVLQHCLGLNKPLLIDADGLNRLAENRHIIADIMTDSLVLTPHPGEAARLLSSDQSLSAADIQDDRFSAIKKIHELFIHKKNCAVVLKGSGTLIFDGSQIKICQLGNAAMAAPGMGDVLSGIIIALQAQKFITNEAAEQGVCLHALAAQRVTGEKTRGLLASDVIDKLPSVLQ